MVAILSDYLLSVIQKIENEGMNRSINPIALKFVINYSIHFSSSLPRLRVAI